MGITIHYRGTMDDVSQIEDMEDRVIDLAVALGGRATVWRSFADHDPTRAIRGVMLDMAPGQETMSLLVTPEGHLISLFEIEDAEKQPLKEPSSCFVKTQFGSEQGHIAIVYLLDALKERYFSNLSVLDESGFYEHRDPQMLSQQMKRTGDAIRGLAKGLQHYGLSSEAAEDPDILASRIARVAQLVAKQMLEDSSARSAAFTEDSEPDFLIEPTLEDEVEAMEQMHRRSERRSWRLIRRIAESTAAGMSVEDAMELALREEGLKIPQLIDSTDDPPEETEDDCSAVSSLTDQQESWRASLDTHSFDESLHNEFDCNREHPTIKVAQNLLLQIMQLEDPGTGLHSFRSGATRGLMDVVGGLVQATSDCLDSQCDRALAIVQLKRALKGHAFCRGAIFGLRSSNSIDEATSQHFHTELAVLLESIHVLMAAAWDEQTDWH